MLQVRSPTGSCGSPQCSCRSVPLGRFFRAATCASSACGPTGLLPPERAGRGSLLDILVAEDSAPIRIALVSALHIAGHRVSAVADGVEAAALLQANAACDLLVTDLEMPRMGGIKLLAAARALRPQLPVILISGTDNWDRNALDERTRFLSKPFQLHRLVELIGTLGQRAGVEE